MMARLPAWGLTAAFLALLCILNIILQPSFVTGNVLQSNIATFLPLILVAIGQTYVVLGGDIDLSAGLIVALSNVVCVQVIDSLGGNGVAVMAGLGAGLATGLVCGVINGLAVAYGRLQPIVASFATGVIFGGLAIWVLPEAGLPVPELYWDTYGGDLFGVRVVVWLLIIAIVIAALIARTRFQRALLATGGNRIGAYQSQVPVARMRLSAYVLSGLFSSAAALCLVGETSSGDPLMGASMTLAAISAVVLGGTALAGGSGGFIGSILGAMILGMINNVIFFAKLPFEMQGLVQGAAVLLALAGGVIAARAREGAAR
ncbi:ABC transporter permease [Lacibacterium aquatile]|uniref:ABC transporter permease n=1 Tax=Lacibacterium aquatile TaxID=1168082 RepID=A0ABW5DM56_9PROT